MSFKREIVPMTAEQLRAIGRRKDPTDIVPLLWEIHRLRALVLRADQVQQCLGPAAPSHFILTVFRQELEGEPCIAERAQMRAEPPGPKTRPRRIAPSGPEQTKS